MARQTAAQREAKNARTCGMSVTDWRAARDQAGVNRTRGRQATAKLATWGEVEGQAGLFEETEAVMAEKTREG